MQEKINYLFECMVDDVEYINRLTFFVRLNTKH